MGVDHDQEDEGVLVMNETLEHTEEVAHEGIEDSSCENEDVEDGDGQEEEDQSYDEEEDDGEEVIEEDCEEIGEL